MRRVLPPRRRRGRHIVGENVSSARRVRAVAPRKCDGAPIARSEPRRDSRPGRPGSTGPPLPTAVDYGTSCEVPDRDTAPGPGRSAAASTVELKVGGTQKMLTRVESWPRPSLRSPAALPLSLIVLPFALLNAPSGLLPLLLPWRQASRDSAPPAGSHCASAV